MQYKVPQNIDLEDKLVGPLTLRQFLYLLIGGSIDYLLIIKFGKGTLLYIIVIVIALFFLALTFIKIQDRPFGEFIVSLVMFMAKPQKRIWHRDTADYKTITESKIEKKKVVAVKKPINYQELENLSQILDSGGKTTEQVQNRDNNIKQK